MTGEMRQLLHKLVGVAGWVVLVVLWALLVRQGKATPGAVGSTAAELAALTGAVLGVTMWWIRHNVAIYRRKGPRTGRPTAAPRVDLDRLGRPIGWAMPGGHLAATAAGRLVVELDGETKIYRRPD